MQKHTALPPSPHTRRTFRQIGKRPASWDKLAFTRAYTLRHGMRAAKLTAIIDCIRCLRREGQMPLP